MLPFFALLLCSVAIAIAYDSFFRDKTNDIVANKVIEQVPEGFSYEFRDIKERAMFHLKVQGIQESGTKDESCPPGYFWCSVDKECKKEVEEENGDDEEEEKKGKKIIDTGGTDIDQLGSGRKPRR